MFHSFSILRLQDGTPAIDSSNPSISVISFGDYHLHANISIPCKIQLLSLYTVMRNISLIRLVFTKCYIGKYKEDCTSCVMVNQGRKSYMGGGGGLIQPVNLPPQVLDESGYL